MVKNLQIFELSKMGKQQKYITLVRRKQFKYLKYFLVPVFIFILVKAESNDTERNLKATKSKIALKDDEATGGKNYEKKVSNGKSDETISKRIANGLLALTPEHTSIQNSYGEGGKDVLQSIEKRSSVTVNISSRLTAAIKCQEYKENCTLFCYNGSVSYIDESLDQLQTNCRNIDLNLMITRCEFNFGTLQQSFFYGYFSLGYLSIDECNLQTIKATAFKHNNVKNLHTLLLTNNQLMSLEIITFDGLTNLHKFEFVQDPLAAPFMAEGFLTPLAKTLTEAIIQPRINDSQVIDPYNWWRKLLMNSLIKLDISNTNLRGILSLSTFEAFTCLEYLVLFNCNLLSIKGDVFDGISRSLKYLDIRHNQLKTLDYHFLEKLAIPSIELNLGLNEWHCECEREIIQYFSTHNGKLTAELVCYTPEKWKQFELATVRDTCMATTNSALFTTTATATTFTTNLPNDALKDTPASSAANTTTIFTTLVKSTTYSTTTNSENSSSNPTTELKYTTTVSDPNAINLITIECCRSEQKPESYNKLVAKPKAQFTFHINSSTSLTVTIQGTEILQTFFIIYFTNYNNDKMYEYDFDIAIGIQIHPEKVNVVVQDLLPTVVYVFCLVTETPWTVSPFDCQAHIIQPENYATKWLLSSDKIWFISVNVIAVVLCFLIPFPIVYILLRFKLNNWPCDRSQVNELTTQSINASPLSRRSSNYLRTVALSENVVESMIYNSQHLVPSLRAPKLPPAATDGKKACSHRTDNLEVNDKEALYQTIESYETIYIRG